MICSFVMGRILRRSVSGMILLISGMMVYWSSCTQKFTVLISVESENVELGECGQELKLICMFLQELCIREIPGIIFVDNEGAIFLAKNQQVGMRTKHIDFKYHFIRELVCDGFIDLRYYSSEENYTKLITKNVGNETFCRLFARGLQVGKIICERESVGRTHNGGIITNDINKSSKNGFPYDLPSKNN